MKEHQFSVIVDEGVQENRSAYQEPVWRYTRQAIWSAINEVENVLGRLNAPVFQLDSEDAEVVFLMLYNCLSDSISAMYTLESGWIRPSVTALRGATETLTTAVAVHHNIKLMKLFREKKLKVPTTVHAAERHLPSIQRLYKELTNEWTHETFDSTARSIHYGTNDIRLVPQICEDRLPIYMNVAVEAIILLQMIGQGAEICFPKLVPESPYFATENGVRIRKPVHSDGLLRITLEGRDLAQEGARLARQRRGED